MDNIIREHTTERLNSNDEGIPQSEYLAWGLL